MQMPKQGIQLFVDFEQVATTIGAIEEAATVADSDRYIGKLINAAFAHTAEEFDGEVVAAAMASDKLHHMFEWGTQGINRGRTTVRLSPNSDAAKLWENVLTGSGKNKGVAFRFKPSKVPVPLPTTTQTGISQRYLSKLNGKHIFWNKAAVMEAGTPVHIAPKNGGKLFIPLKGMNGVNIRPQDKARGFIMTSKPVTAVPGAQSAGTFTSFWEAFWQGRGSETMAAHMEKRLQAHLERVNMKASRTRGRMGPAGKGAVERAVSRGRAIGAEEMNNAASAEDRRK
jgi:hypothetical protein